ncbi:MAG: 30S ribosomal protein S5 [Patescibacteria group bacterium]|nr:30S ribosomal protein S5 [Patescibacteria group bacterium]
MARFTRTNQTGGMEEALLDLRRVTKVTKGGKNMRFRAALIVGDKNGRIGFGIAKASEVPKAVEKAKLKATKNMIKVPIVDGTIPFAVNIKFKSAKIFLKPASSGTGLIVGRLIRPLVELSGVTNILSKVQGSRDKVVNAQAMMKAFAELNMLYLNYQNRNKLINKSKSKAVETKINSKIKNKKSADKVKK